MARFTADLLQGHFMAHAHQKMLISIEGLNTRVKQRGVSHISHIYSSSTRLSTNVITRHVIYPASSVVFAVQIGFRLQITEVEKWDYRYSKGNPDKLDHSSYEGLVLYSYLC